MEKSYSPFVLNPCTDCQINTIVHPTDCIGCDRTNRLKFYSSLEELEKMDYGDFLLNSLDSSKFNKTDRKRKNKFPYGVV